MRYRCFFLLVLVNTILLLTTGAVGQVIVKLQQPPPNLLREADLWKLLLNNTSQTTHRVFIKGTLDETRLGRLADGASGIITLPPGAKTITINDLKQGGSVNIKPGPWQEVFLRTGNAPSGNYTICVYVKTQDGFELGSDCINQVVEIISPPMLVAPADGEAVVLAAGVTAVSIQPVYFTWMPPAPAQVIISKAIIRYKLRIVEVVGKQSPQEAMKRNKAWFETSDISATTFNYPLAAKPFEKGKYYAWQVTAFSNNAEIGSSEIWRFTTKVGTLPPPTITKVEPISGEQGKTLELTIWGKDFVEGAQVSFCPAEREPKLCNRKLEVIKESKKEVTTKIFHHDGKNWRQVEGKKHSKTSDPPPKPPPPKYNPCDHYIQTLENDSTTVFILYHLDDNREWKEHHRVVLNKDKSKKSIDFKAIEFASSTVLKTTLCINKDAPLGKHDIIVTNKDGQSGILKGGFATMEKAASLSIPTVLSLYPETIALKTEATPSGIRSGSFFDIFLYLEIKNIPEKPLIEIKPDKDLKIISVSNLDPENFLIKISINPGIILGKKTIYVFGINTGSSFNVVASLTEEQELELEGKMLKNKWRKYKMWAKGGAIIVEGKEIIVDQATRMDHASGYMLSIMKELNLLPPKPKKMTDWEFDNAIIFGIKTGLIQGAEAVSGIPIPIATFGVLLELYKTLGVLFDPTVKGGLDTLRKKLLNRGFTENEVSEITDEISSHYNKLGPLLKK